MAGLLDRIMRMLSPEAAEAGAEDDIIAMAPEAIRERLKRRIAEERERRKNKTPTIMSERKRAIREAEEAR